MGKINVKRIETCMGEITSFGDQLDYLTESELKEFNLIGSSSKNSKGEKMTREKYLNSLDKGQFEVEQYKFDKGDFREKFIVVRVY